MPCLVVCPHHWLAATTELLIIIAGKPNREAVRLLAHGESEKEGKKHEISPVQKPKKDDVLEIFVWV